MNTTGPALPSATVQLREVFEADLPIHFEHQRDPGANRMAAFPARTWEAFIAHWTKILNDESKTIRTILFDGHVAGNIGYWKQGDEHLVGYWIGKEFWGKGVASSALAKFLGLCRTRPLFAYVAKHNAASIRVLEKCGFTLSADAHRHMKSPAKA